MDIRYQVEDVWQSAPSATACFALLKVPVRLATVASCSQPTAKAVNSIAGSFNASPVLAAPLARLAILAICSTLQPLLVWCSVPAASIA